MSAALKLPRFDELSPEQRSAHLDEVHEQLEIERVWYAPESEISLSEATFAHACGEVVVVDPFLDEDHFGVVSNIRGKLPSVDHAVEEQSYPLLRPRAYELLTDITARAHDSFAGSAVGVEDSAFSITSMFRTTAYQQFLVDTGFMASIPGDCFSSSHCHAAAFDIDHSGFYALVGGRWVSVNPESNQELFMANHDALRGSLLAAIEAAHSKHEFNHIHELPEGRGCHHIAAKPI